MREGVRVSWPANRIREIETFASRKTFMKLAGGAKCEKFPIIRIVAASFCRVGSPRNAGQS